MKGSLNLGKFSGIRVEIHWTFFLLIGWIVLLGVSSGSDTVSILWNIAFMLLLFLCVVMHEYGHALTARRYNIPTRKITLLPIGGVASFEEMPEDPKQELLVAIAGPAVNVAIALLLWLVVPVEQYLNQDPEALQETLGTITGGNLMFYLLIANVMLVVFNLLPAFPMDGGRVLRALLTMRMGRVRATQIAAFLGQTLAFFFFLSGLIYNPFLILIALFVYFGAQGENMMVQQLKLLENHQVRDAMMTDITVLDPGDYLNRVVDIILSGTERDFIVTEHDHIKGVVYHSDLVQLLRQQNGQAQVKDVMSTDFENVHADDDLTDVYRKVQARKKSFFPVLENDRLVGAIDMNNINEFIVFRASLDF